MSNKTKPAPAVHNRKIGSRILEGADHASPELPSSENRGNAPLRMRQFLIERDGFALAPGPNLAATPVIIAVPSELHPGSSALEISITSIGGAAPSQRVANYDLEFRIESLGRVGEDGSFGNH